MPDGQGPSWHPWRNRRERCGSHAEEGTGRGKAGGGQLRSGGVEPWGCEWEGRRGGAGCRGREEFLSGQAGREPLHTQEAEGASCVPMALGWPWHREMGIPAHWLESRVGQT